MAIQKINFNIANNTRTFKGSEAFAVVQNNQNAQTPASEPTAQKKNNKTVVLAATAATLVAVALIFHKKLGSLLGLGKKVKNIEPEISNPTTQVTKPIIEEIKTEEKPQSNTLTRKYTSKPNTEGTGLLVFNSSGKKVKEIIFSENKKVPETIIEFGPESGRVAKETLYVNNSRMIQAITKPEYDNAGNVIKESVFHPDGKKLRFTRNYKYDESNNLIETSALQPDGKIIFVTEHNPQTGEETLVKSYLDEN